ncbi:MAG TPA: aminotransferase class V-fold PLP-dependent enzyme, partial [Gemmatimonadales bacterium]|nr:aminotransferase class V-fold PLP-dependent enzyme [Gemmatimonadales bacterium]
PLYDVAALRRAEFPWSDSHRFVNHASTGPIPERTRRVLAEFTGRRATPFRLPDDELQAILAGARQRAARLINAEVGEIALATNTSFGLNLAARMLPFRPGDVVLVSDGEFPANVFPWKHLGDRGVRMELLPVTREGWPDEVRMVERMGDPAVRALAVSHVQFHTGYRVDLARLGDRARATGTFLVVDAIQALGQVPFDVRETPVDILACGGQKWLLSPWGSGFLYVRRELIGELVSPLAGWSAFVGTDNFATLCDYSGALRSDARRYELVTLPFQDLLGMSHSLDLLDELGIASIQAHLSRIGAPVAEWAIRSGVRLVSPPPEDPRGSGIICLAADALPGALPALRAAGITASVREGALRLSPHCYNTVEEMELLVGVLDPLFPTSSPPSPPAGLSSQTRTPGRRRS